MFKRRGAKLGEHFIDMPGSVPITVQVPPSREEEGRTALAVHLFGMMGEITKCVPGMTFGVRNRKNSAAPIYRQITTRLSKCEQPRIAADEVRGVGHVSTHLSACSFSIERTEKNDQIVAGKARWIDLRTR